MSTAPTRRQAWSDAQLKNAVSVSGSWRGVLRELGLNVTSASAVRRARRHAVRLGLDTSHFRGRRTWSDAQLMQAVSQSTSWDEVLAALGLSANSGNVRIHLKGHAVRIGLDISHLSLGVPVEPQSREVAPDLRHLREAGASIAAAWFALCGCSALFPVEPAAYDLVVAMPDGLSRVQVTTTTTVQGQHGWQVTVGRHPYSAGNKAPRVPYDPDVIEYFFIIDGDLDMYLIPSRVIAGRVGLLLRTYKAYIVGNAGGLLGGAGARTEEVASARAARVGA